MIFRAQAPHDTKLVAVGAWWKPRGLPVLKPVQSPQDVFDLASLTKVFFTALLLKRWAESKGLRFGSDMGCVGDWVQVSATHSELAKLSLRDLAEHRSGLEAHFGLSQTREYRPELAWSFFETDELLFCLGKRPLGKPAGSELYSDLGFWLLTWFLSRAFDRPLRSEWELLRMEILEGHEHGVLHFGPELLTSNSFVETSQDFPAGQVHDDNAAWLGGVSGHAGLFANLEGIAAVLDWLNRHRQSFIRVREPHRFCWGWDQPSGPDSLAGASAPRMTLGHLGFTGTSFWWDPDSGAASVLLTNRVYPSASSESLHWIREFRRRFHGEFWTESGDPSVFEKAVLNWPQPS